MHLFDADGNICKYTDPLEILDHFFAVRLRGYVDRRDHQLSALGKVLAKLQNQVRFTRLICSGELVVAKQRKEAIIQELAERGFDQQSAFELRLNLPKGSIRSDDPSSGDDDPKVYPSDNGFDYLLRTPLWDLTQEKVDALEGKLKERELELQALESCTPQDLWAADLARLKEALTKIS